ncbi:hypothetical protein DL96DRAFT_1629552 [Flagelloscypha sp. PMI_526]|nr:hypothetical protein DL96DRAFT_1629552 [Flagelloscypha sp. PMI_526]
MAYPCHSFNDLPYELQSEIFAMAGEGAGTQRELISLLHLCKTSYQSVLPALYYNLLINNGTYQDKMEIFKRHKELFTIHCRALRIVLTNATASQIDEVWKHLLPGLPKVAYFESYFGNWDAYHEYTGSEYCSHTIALRAISALSLRHLRLDWHFNTSMVLTVSPSPIDGTPFTGLISLRVVLQRMTQPSPNLFRYFPSLTHLQLILARGAPTPDKLIEYCSNVIEILPCLQLLLVSHSSLMKIRGLTFDSRIVVKTTPSVRDDDCFLGIIRDEPLSLWRYTEHERDDQKEKRGSMQEQDGKYYEFYV